MFTSMELARKVGVSYRKIDYWARLRLLLTTPAPGSGHKREFDEKECMVARYIGAISDASNKLPTARECQRVREARAGECVVSTTRPDRAEKSIKVMSIDELGRFDWPQDGASTVVLLRDRSTDEETSGGIGIRWSRTQ